MVPVGRAEQVEQPLGLGVLSRPDRPAEFDAAIAELTDTMARFAAAREPDDLLG